jgi:hypothetical protein
MHATPLHPRRALAAAAAALALLVAFMLPTTLDGADFSIGVSGRDAPAVSAPAPSVTPSALDRTDWTSNPFSRPFLQPAGPTTP